MGHSDEMNQVQKVIMATSRVHTLRAVQLFSSSPFLTEHAQCVTQIDHVINFEVARVPNVRSSWKCAVE